MQSLNPILLGGKGLHIANLKAFKQNPLNGFPDYNPQTPFTNSWVVTDFNIKKLWNTKSAIIKKENKNVNINRIILTGLSANASPYASVVLFLYLS